MLEITEQSNVLTVKGAVTLQGVSIPVYSFLVDGMLIDTSTIRLQNELISFYEKHHIELVSLTHWHEDHTGTAAWLQENKQVPIYIHPMSVEVCNKPANYPQYRQMFWGVRKLFSPKPYHRAVVQSRTQNWEVIETPGHSLDHVALFNHETGVLFSGDLFVTPKPRIILEEESIPLTMQSLRKVLQYDFQEMFCSHSGYHPDGRSMVRMKLAYLEEIQDKILQMHKSGKNMEEIKAELFPRVPPIQSISANEWDASHIITTIIREQ